MDIKDAVTFKEGCRILGTYDKVLNGVAARHGIKFQNRGRIRYIQRSDLEKLRPDVEAWHNRPRLAELATAAP